MTVAVPQEVGLAHRPSTRDVTTSEVFLKLRVWFPLHPCFKNILNFYGLTVFQVMPNGWAHMIALFLLFVEQKMDPPSPKEFSRFYTFMSNKVNLGFYYFTKRATKEVQVVAKIKETLGNLKDTYFFKLEVGVRGRFGEPSEYLVFFFCRIYLYATCRSFV